MMSSSVDTDVIAPRFSRDDSAATALLEGYRKMPQPVFAVMDGAKFVDLIGTLKELDFQHRSLFVQHGDVEIEAAGGWLVPVEDEHRMSTLLSELPNAESSLVLWSCPGGEVALHRHLRSINLVLIPEDEILEQENLGEEKNKDSAEQIAANDQTVLFRHYDPNVVGSILPLLDENQFSRFFGPAIHVAWYASDHGGRRRAPRPEGLPIAPRGMLRISSDQISELQEVRTLSSQRKIANYLLEIAPQETAEMNDQQMSAFISKSYKEGTELGLRSERAQGFWAYLQLYSAGRIGRDPSTRNMFLNHPELGTPDDKIFILMRRLSSLPDRN